MRFIIGREFVLSDVAVFSVICYKGVACLDFETGILSCVVVWVLLVGEAEGNADVAVENFVGFELVDVAHVATDVPDALSVGDVIDLSLA